MARKKFSTLTEPMSYLLMSLRGGKKCGIDDPDAPEIYTDPELLVKPLKKISSKLLAS